MESELSTTVSVSRKINLGNYEAADVFISVSNITLETTQEQIDELLDGPCNLAFKSISKRIADKVKQCKEAK